MRLIVYRAPSYKSLALGTTRRICFTTRLADESKQGTANEQAAQAEREEAERAIYNSKQMRHFQAAMSNPVIKPYHQKRTPFQTKEKRRLIDQIRESRDQERSTDMSTMHVLLNILVLKLQRLSKEYNPFRKMTTTFN